ncbi:hypothetical protein P3T20_005112 [Paraburkholderia sp. GAS206C]
MASKWQRKQQSVDSACGPVNGNEMRAARKQPKVRLNLDMSVEVKEQIEALRDRMHADSMSEVIRRALAIYDFLLTQQADGSITVIRSKDGSEKQIPLI